MHTGVPGSAPGGPASGGSYWCSTGGHKGKEKSVSGERGGAEPFLRPGRTAGSSHTLHTRAGHLSARRCSRSTQRQQGGACCRTAGAAWPPRLRACVRAVAHQRVQVQACSRLCKHTFSAPSLPARPAHSALNLSAATPRVTRRQPPLHSCIMAASTKVLALALCALLCLAPLAQAAESVPIPGERGELAEVWGLWRARSRASSSLLP